MNVRTNFLGETEKRCSKCGDWWPADNEFFSYYNKSIGKLNSWCKACSLEYRLYKNKPLNGANLYAGED